MNNEHDCVVTPVQNKPVNNDSDDSDDENAENRDDQNGDGV